MLQGGGVRQGDPYAGGIAFRRGWFASGNPVTPVDLDDWITGRFNDLSFGVHPALSWAQAGHGAHGVLLLGDAVDLDTGSTDIGRIADRTLDELRRGGLPAGIRAAAYLGGRSVCFLTDGPKVLVVPDCSASMPIFWHTDDAGCLTLSSHGHLAAEITGADLNTSTMTILQTAKDRKVKGTIFLPGAETMFVGIKPVLPNHLLDITADGVRHQRFYPFPETKLDANPETAYAAFHTLFTEHTRLLCEPGRVTISLTGGKDSRASLHAALPHLRRDSFAWTYRPVENTNQAIEDDVLAARLLAAKHGLRHQVVLLYPTQNQEFVRGYARTYRRGGQHRRLAEAVNDQLPRDVVHLQSMISAAGTGFHKTRQGAPTPERLAYLYSRTELGRIPEVVAAMTTYLEYTDLGADRLGPYDYHDAYYWEIRLGRWAAIRIQELDLSHRVALPFNARGIIEALAGPSFEERSGKQALMRFVDG